MNYPPELPEEDYSLLNGQIVSHIPISGNPGMGAWEIKLDETYFGLYNMLPSRKGEISVNVDYAGPGVYRVKIGNEHCFNDRKFTNLATQISAFVSETLIHHTIEEYTYIFNVIASNLERIINHIYNYKLSTGIP